MRTKRKITSWNDDRGYGFIAPLDGSRRIFVHAKAFGNRSRRPNINEVVTYSISADRQGRPCAVDATLAGDKLVKKAAQSSNRVAIAFAFFFLATIAVTVLVGPLPVAFLLGYLILSLISFVAYTLDKSAAQRGAWRTSEGTLLMLGLIGGWPGALIAQESLRHKS
jgi:cold shock CspA family protein